MRRESGGKAVVAALVLGAGCFVDQPLGGEEATGAEASTAAGSTTSTPTTTTSTAPPTSSESTVESSGSASSQADASTSAPPECPTPCDAPPSPCFDSLGECVEGECVYAPLGSGSPCDDGDPCTAGEACDGGGACGGGAPMVCEAPNAVGSCSGGACEWSCVGEWENCDDDWANGCEVPTGVPNRCSADGLDNPAACWTAYCGSSPNAKVNFGTFYCSGCPNCHVPAPGYVQWCSPQLGIWFPQDQGTCGAYEDLVCPP